ncbi:MAG: hypothetical protein A3H98_13125 [Bacteroidetes bacterium RIFCSPLOWO2_02_FULL_36_8]|nr:MAG: hypothetical protein A3H98_13125 [Bacteroidetes bacterium RIFCSPLOWO2_02_FULL_36_8]OFY70236.1 MAG: hypothetical protein A3G23_08825 [Bacteroidetes bacterium RIFCSPLOWO2_12_FULL_37_12]
MIKNKPSYPFETIGVAIAFSPRLESIIVETHRLAKLFGAKVLFIHIGKNTKEKEKRLVTLLTKHNYYELNYQTIWAEGDTVDTVLSTCKQNIVDLLIFGALEKENLMRYYLGSISREICRKAKCSVLVLVKPSMTPKPFRSLLVNGIEHPKTVHTLNTALYFAKYEKSEKVAILKEIYLPALSMAIADENTEPEVEKIKQELVEEELKKLKTFVSDTDPSKLVTDIHCLVGKPGYTISQYSKEHKTDMLIMNSPDKNLNILDRIFTHDIEYVLAKLPCNLLIVHSRVNG